MLVLLLDYISISWALGLTDCSPGQGLMGYGYSGTEKPFSCSVSSRDSDLIW